MEFRVPKASSRVQNLGTNGNSVNEAQGIEAMGSEVEPINVLKAFNPRTNDGWCKGSHDLENGEQKMKEEGRKKSKVGM